jgi:hypothetical protein
LNNHGDHRRLLGWGIGLSLTRFQIDPARQGGDEHYGQENEHSAFHFLFPFAGENMALFDAMLSLASIKVLLLIKLTKLNKPHWLGIFWD